MVQLMEMGEKPYACTQKSSWNTSSFIIPHLQQLMGSCVRPIHWGLLCTTWGVRGLLEHQMLRKKSYVIDYPSTSTFSLACIVPVSHSTVWQMSNRFILTICNVNPNNDCPRRQEFCLRFLEHPTREPNFTSGGLFINE